jgi:8-oxo-dGTP pyrophosphatase MutT (NUDIX family)
MYKVFFNDSTLIINSEINKSLTKSYKIGAVPMDIEALDQVIYEMEHASSPVEFTFCHHEPEMLLQFLRSRFVEISAAGGIVQNQDGAWLFIKRLGMWDLPKGKIEKKETPEIAAIREVKEECGISNLKILKKLDPTFHFYRSPFLSYPNNLVLKETKWFLMEYNGSETPMPQTEEHIEEVRWISRLDLNSILTGTYSSLRDLIFKTSLFI